MAFKLTSPAFKDGQPIPTKYVRDGDNVSPPLEWRDPPPETKSFALVVEDPDAPKGTFRHWALYDLPPDAIDLPENVSHDALRYREGMNDFGAIAYDGPQPPSGHGLHHYHFRLVALDVDKLDVPRKATAEEVIRAAKAHMIGEADLVGTFEQRA
jgi:Raf kinase inhibitor-like YbhB/YbcL family protein